MDATRAVAVELVKEGVVDITRRGVKVDPDAIRGPIRLRLSPRRADDVSGGDPSTGGEAVKATRGARLDARIDRNIRGSGVAAVGTRAPVDAKRRKTRRDGRRGDDARV